MGKRIIPQHEPLRVPKGWTEQARAFVIQLERIIDRIYAYVSGGFSKHDEEIETLDASQLTKPQNLTEEQKATVRANVDLNVANNLTTTAAGSVLDARQGKVLKDAVDGIKGNLTIKTVPADATLTTWIEQNAPNPGVLWFYPGNITDETQIPADFSGGNTYRWYSVGRVIRLNTVVMTVELIPYASGHQPVMYRYKNANGWGNWSLREQRNVVVRKIKTYSNITIPSNGYVIIDNFAGIINGDDRVNNSWYVISMTISGWNGATLPINIVKGTNRTDFYVIGQPQTISSLTVEYFLFNNNNVLS